MLKTKAAAVKRPRWYLLLLGAVAGAAVGHILMNFVLDRRLSATDVTMAIVKVGLPLGLLMILMSGLLRRVVAVNDSKITFDSTFGRSEVPAHVLTNLIVVRERDGAVSRALVRGRFGLGLPFSVDSDSAHLTDAMLRALSNTDSVTTTEISLKLYRIAQTFFILITVLVAGLLLSTYWQFW